MGILLCCFRVKEDPHDSDNRSSLDRTRGNEAVPHPYFFVAQSSDEVCATCLEEYDDDNPRILLQCSHGFHLSCIYEWMERSPFCPFCGKVMIFL